MADRTIADRIEKAAAFLDKYCSNKQWRDEIDVDILDMGSNEECVLGQIYGDYGTGMDKLRRIAGAVIYDDDDYSGTFAGFTSAWKEYLKNYGTPKVGDVYVSIIDSYDKAERKVIAVFDYNGEKHITYDTCGVLYTKTASRLLGSNALKVEPKYEYGKLYTGMKDGKTIVLLYTATEYHSGPGFFFLGDSTYGSVSLFEQKYGPIKPLNLLYSSDMTARVTITKN